MILIWPGTYASTSASAGHEVSALPSALIDFSKEGCEGEIRNE